MATLASEAFATEPVKPPSRLLAFSEFHRALFELATLPLTSPLLYNAPRGDDHPVLVLPGFMASDRSTRILRRYLERLGYDVYKWDLGRNLGPRSIGHDGEILHERLHDIMESHGEKVSIVGWSLGGAMGRQLGERFPDVVRQVITLGSPLQGSPRSTSVWRVYEAATGQKINSEVIARHMEELAAPPKVPTTAIYSKADGVVPWQNCRVEGSEFAENVEVYGSHMGLGINGTVLYVIADRLGQKIEDWKPFSATGLSSALFPANRDS